MAHFKPELIFSTRTGKNVLTKKDQEEEDRMLEMSPKRNDDYYVEPPLRDNTNINVKEIKPEPNATIEEVLEIAHKFFKANPESLHLFKMWSQASRIKKRDNHPYDQLVILLQIYFESLRIKNPELSREITRMEESLNVKKLEDIIDDLFLNHEPKPANDKLAPCLMAYVISIL